MPRTMDQWVIDITPIASSPLAQNRVLDFSFFLLDDFHLQQRMSVDGPLTTVQGWLPQVISSKR